MERPDPVIFNASLDSLSIKRRKFGMQPEVTMKLSAAVSREQYQDLVHLQEMYMQVAFAPAQAVMPLEPPE